MRLVAALSLFALALAACGGNGDDGSDNPPTAAADDGADAGDDGDDEECEYPAGSTVSIHVPGSVGGGSDTTARIIAPFLSEHIPGQPTVIVTNYPDDIQVNAANRYINEQPSDGTQLLLLSRSSTLPVILGMEGVQYGFENLYPLVGFQSGGVVYVRSGIPIEDASDLVAYTDELVYGSSGAIGGNTPTHLLWDILEQNVNEVFGYDGNGPVRIAIEQGEVDINYDTTASVIQHVEPLEEAGVVRPLFSFGVLVDGELERDPLWPDLPHAIEVYEMKYGERPSGEAWEAYEGLAVPGFTLNKSLWLQDDAPDWAKCAMRAGIEAMEQDLAFDEERGEEIGPYALYQGEGLEATVASAFNMDPAVIAWLADWLGEKYDADFDDF